MNDPNPSGLIVDQSAATEPRRHLFSIGPDLVSAANEEDAWFLVCARTGHEGGVGREQRVVSAPEASQMPKIVARVELWSLNRWFRWTGFRLFVAVDVGPDPKPTVVGVAFYGWKDLL